MNGFSGAWSLDGRPPRLSPESRAALRAAAGPRGLELAEGALWLCAPPDAVARRGPLILAYDGLLAGRAEDCRAEALLDAWREGPAPRKAGHWAALRADAAAGELRLARDVFGMGRLYLAEKDGLLLFSTHARALLAAGAGGGLDREAALEAVLGGDLGVIFGGRTLLAGVEELPLGEELLVAGGRRERRAPPHPYAECWSPEPAPPASELRRALLEAVRAAIGGRERAAVALSGGIDSSMVAAMAADLLGPERVEAFTYEFDDAEHGSEAAWAAAVCRRLGIAHHVVRVERDAWLESVPELFWRLEAPRAAPGAWLPLSRALGERGYDRVLTGDGMELFLGLTREFQATSAAARAAAALPGLERFLWHWRPNRFAGWPKGGLLQRLYSGFEPPPRTAYHMTLCVLRHNGALPDVGVFYPEELRALARESAESPRVRAEIGLRRGMPLAEQLRLHRLNHYYSHRLWRGKPAAWRELGGARPACPPLLVPGGPVPRKERWPNDRTLHRAAVGGYVPEEVWNRPKVTNQSIVPASWSAGLEARLAPLAGECAERLDVGGAAREALLSHYPRELALLGLWARVFEGPARSEPPTLGSLAPTA